MTEFLNFTILGLVTAAIYAVAASGLVVTYTTSGIFNFAQGAMGMLSAFIYWQFAIEWGWPAPLALLVVLGIIAPLFGATVERVIMRGLTDVSEVTKIVVSVALLFGVFNLAPILFPAAGRRLPGFFAPNSFGVFGVNVTWHNATTVIVAIIVAIGLRAFLFRTRTGIAMRGVVDDRDLAELNGARPARAAMLAWAMGASPREGVSAGIALVPEDRKREGIVPDLPVRENFTLPLIGRITRFFLILAGRERATVQAFADRLNLNPPRIERPMGTFSGGNQQKVVLGKWLLAKPEVLILDEPTRGVDVGAKADIHRIIGEFAESGGAVLMISSELSELLAVCDRIFVLHEGGMVAEIPRQSATEESVMRAATGQVYA